MGIHSMTELPPDYLAQIGQQLATLSAFLAGFAIAFIGLVLTIPKPNPTAGWVAGSAATAAAAFALSVVGWTMIAIVLHPAAPVLIKQTAHLQSARIVGGLGFIIGIYSLVISLGLSGWIRSRALGWLTTTIAIVAASLMTWLIV